MTRALGGGGLRMRSFEESFTGVVLTFEKGMEFRRQGSPPSVDAGAAASPAWGLRCRSCFLLVASFIGVIPGLANAAYARVFVDNILLGGVWGWMKAAGTGDVGYGCAHVGAWVVERVGDT